MARRRAAALALRRVAPAPLLALGFVLALAAGRAEGASGPCSSLDVSALFPTGSGGGGSASPDIGAMMVGGGAPRSSPPLRRLRPPAPPQEEEEAPPTVPLGQSDNSLLLASGGS